LEKLEIVRKKGREEAERGGSWREVCNLSGKGGDELTS